MTTFEFPEDSAWGGHPVARRVADTRPRARAVITGLVISAQEAKTGDITSYHCLVDDGTGAVSVLFLGRHLVPGMRVGRRCTVEGTVGLSKGEKVIWNPLYRLEPDAGD
jgi:RecG-like helicase